MRENDDVTLRDRGYKAATSLATAFNSGGTDYERMFKDLDTVIRVIFLLQGWIFDVDPKKTDPV